MNALDPPAPDRPSGVPDPLRGPYDDAGAEAGDRERLLRRVRRPTPSRRLRRLHPVRPTAPEGTTAGAPDWTEAEETGRAPLGVLISGSATVPAPAGGGTRRVGVRLARIGAGTCLVVLPAWREAIAVSVPTERLLASTGLRLDELPHARITVVINPDALHDRDLGLCGWRVEEGAGR